jgi:hypothetical protein
MNRRRLLQAMAAAGGVTLGGALTGGLAPVARAGDDGPRFLVIFGCFGGASMLDCFIPVDSALALTDPSRGTVISYPTVAPIGGTLRCPDRSTPVDFLTQHGRECVAMGYQGSSVNHFEAQSRSVNGRGAFKGRTMAEAMAAAYGGEMPLPNVNMGRGGFSEVGLDDGLDPRFRAEIVTNPVTFALSTSGHAGILPVGDRAIEDPDTRAALVAKARSVRDEVLERESTFARTFPTSRVRQDLLARRRDHDPLMEEQNLIEELLFVPDMGKLFPLSQYGITPSDEVDLIEDYLDDAQPVTTSAVAEDRFEAQAALAYLLIRNEVATAITLTDPGTDGFLAFDNSHTDHLTAQADHWDRALKVASKLIQLLKSAEYIDPAGKATGTSYWDRTMIVFATEFGRDKWNTGSGFGTGHNMNNGILAVSPLLDGGKALGEADPDNGHICGYDLETGEPERFRGITPGEDPLYDDPHLPPGEEVIFGGLLDVLGVSYEGQQTLPALRKS